MADYWLDADVFIQAKDGPYTFDRVPAFWQFLDQKAASGQVSSCQMVYGELAAGNDYLAKWVKGRKSTLFRSIDNSVQAACTSVADYVTERFSPSEAGSFLRGADPWIIARAIAYGGKVVTIEGLAPQVSKTPKIPNVCQHFGVGWVHYYRMLEELGAKFG